MLRSRHAPITTTWGVTTAAAVVTAAVTTVVDEVAVAPGGRRMVLCGREPTVLPIADGLSPADRAGPVPSASYAYL
jgi:hypothetical protein